MRNRQVENLKLKSRRKSGTEVECLFDSSRIRSGTKSNKEYQDIIPHIISNKDASNTIYEQEAFLKFALDALSHPFLVIDVDDYTVKMANKAANIYNMEDGKTCYKLAHGLDQPCSKERLDAVCPLEAVVRTREPVMLEHEHYDKNGNARYFEIHAYPLLDSNGKVIRILEYTLDITEEKKAKQELELLGTVVEKSVDGIVITKPDWVIQYVNPAFKTAGDYSGNELIGRKVEIFKNGQHDAGIYREILDTIKNDNVWNGHFTNKRKDGTLFEEEITVSPVKDKSGGISNYVVIKRDVTEKKRLKSIAEATNLMDKLGYIFSGIRHEIGNPVNSIKMTLAVLNKNIQTYSRDKIEELVIRALDDVSRVEYLLKALRNYSMFERPKIQKVWMNDFIKCFLSLVKEDIEKKGIQIKTSLPPDIIMCPADPRALHQVMLNLLTNAVDALEGRAGASNYHPSKTMESTWCGSA